MKTKLSFSHIAKAFLGILFVVAGYLGSSACRGNADNIYLANIQSALPYTPNRRALVQLDEEKVESSAFEKFRQNVHKSNYAYSNAYRLNDEGFIMKIGNFSFSPETNLMDYSFNQLTEKTDLMIFPSFGSTPVTQEDFSQSIILDSSTAEVIVSILPQYNQISDLIDESVTLLNPHGAGDGEEALSGVTLRVAAIAYLLNDKPYLEYINNLVYMAHGSSVYIPNTCFDDMGFNENCHYFSNFVWDGQHEYPFRTFYFLKELLGTSDAFVFPEVESNTLKNYRFSQMNDVTAARNAFEDSPIRALVSVFSIVISSLGFLLITSVFLSLELKLSFFELKFLCYYALVIGTPILAFFSVSVFLPGLIINNLFVPFFGTINTLLFVLYSVLSILFCWVKYALIRNKFNKRNRVTTEIIIN